MINDQNGYRRLMRLRGVKLRILAAAMVLMVAPWVMAQAGNRSPIQGPPTAQPAGNQPGVQQGGVRPGVVPVGSADAPSAMQEQMKLERNALRQKKLMEKTAQLQQLSNELKVEIDKTDKDTLSLEVIRKSEQIEKLAKSIHELMVTHS